MKKSVVVLVVLAGFLMGSVSLFAHHGTGASYDMHKVVVLKGTVVRFAMSNPHSQMYFDVTDDKGAITHWSAEMRNPRNLESAGYSRKQLIDKFAPGTPITITGNPSKAGTPVLVLGKAELADGWSLTGAGSPAPGVVGGLVE
jgi:hypothetical protein